MKLLTCIILSFVVTLAAASPEAAVDYAALKARHFAGKPVARALDNHVRDAELVVRTTTGEEIIQRDMSPHDAAVFFEKRCCSIKCGDDVCCCNGCC